MKAIPVRPIRVGDRVHETFQGRTITCAGRTAEVSEEQYAAIARAAAARRLTVEAFLAGFNGSSSAGAQQLLRIAITPYLPAAYRWPIVCRSVS